MKPNTSERDEEALYKLIADYDEALATDAPTERLEQTATQLHPQLVAEWSGAKECLEFVERLRRRGELSRALPTTSPKIAEKTPSGSQCVGRFLIERELGRGGLGIVFLAHDPQLGRKVALKIPRFEALLDDDLRSRFLREAEAAARLNHPNLVALYEVGQDGPMCYLASEYCSGPTLAQWLSEQNSPVRFSEAARIVLLLANAVAHAHCRGVLHRDIKPSNVMLTAMDNDFVPHGSVIPKLTDFGMAKLLEQDGGGRTRTGAILGTLAYMAPEQVEGRTCDLDARVDVYALGAILYELLTCKAPYTGQNDVDTLRQLIAREPELPRRSRSNIPRDLEAIVLKALARDPKSRYSTASDLADDLRRFLDGRSTVARPTGISVKVAKWIRRRPAIAALGLLCIVAVTSAATFNKWRVEATIRSEAESTRLRRLADDHRKRLADKTALSSRMQYASQIRRAQQAWRDGDLTLMRSILANYHDGTPEAGLRHFEWFHLNHLANLPHLKLRGHVGEVFAVAYSGDGRTIVTGGEDGTVRLWDAESGEPRGVMREHTSCVNGIDFAPNGDTFVTCSCDTTINLWSLREKKLLATFTGHTQEVDACLFIDDGRTLASLSRHTTAPREVHIWDVATQSMRTDWPPPGEGKQGLVAGRTGKALVTFANDQAAIWVRRGNSWSLSHRSERIKPTNEAILSPDEEFLITSNWPHNLQTFRLSDGLLVNDVTDHAARVTGMSVSPSRTRLATAAGDNSVRIFEFPSGKHQQCLLGHEGKVWKVAWSPTEKSLASTGSDGTVRVWDLARTSSPRQLNLSRQLSSNSALRALGILKNSQHVSALYHDGHHEVWDFATGEIVSSDSVPDSEQAAKIPRPDWSQVVDVTSEQAIDLGELGPTASAKLSPTGKSVLVRDSTVREFDAQSGAVIRDYPCPRPTIVGYSGDSERIALASELGFVIVFDAVTGEELVRLDSHGYGEFVFSRDKETLLMVEPSNGRLFCWPGS